MYALASKENAIEVTKNLTWGFGTIRKMEPMMNVTTYAPTWMVLFSAPEQFGASYITGYYTDSTDIKWVSDAGFTTPIANYGEVLDVYGFSNVNGSRTALYGVAYTHVIIAGKRLGKGMVGAVALLSNSGAVGVVTKTSATIPVDILHGTATGVSYVNNTSVREIRSPAGGIMQFKGLTQTTSNDQYVEVRCTGVQPYLAGATAWRNIANTAPTTESNGFLITCMTGIAQCVMDVTVQLQAAATTLLSALEHKACIEDPRYLTWRMMNVAMKYEGTVQWYRTDSFWNPSMT